MPHLRCSDVVRKQIASNGANKVGWYLSSANDGNHPVHWLAHTGRDRLPENAHQATIDDIPTVNDYRDVPCRHCGKIGSGCITGCRRSSTHEDVEDEWQAWQSLQAPLCKYHHDLWHDLVTPWMPRKGNSRRKTMNDSDPTFKGFRIGLCAQPQNPPGDPFWKDFNGSFQNKTLSCLELADSVYTEHPFTTWHHNHWRTSASYDQDSISPSTSTPKTSDHRFPFYAKTHFIAKHAAFLYTTPATPPGPKAAWCFRRYPIMQTKNYVALAVSALLWLNGTADRQCKRPVRFFYGSRDCDVIYLENVLPLATIKHIIGQYLETGQTTRRAMQPGLAPAR